MRRNLLFAFFGLGFGLATSLLPAMALGQTNVVVLGIRSHEGDDDFARELTDAVRTSASGISGWEVSDRRITLTQMAAIYGCGENPDPPCLTQIAERLGAARLIYGDVQRTSAREQYAFAISLSLFNHDSGAIETTVAETLGSGVRDDSLRAAVDRFVAELVGAPAAGSLRVRVNVPGASVFLDGSPAGTVNDDGELVVSNVAAGNHQVRITAAGYDGFSSTVAVEAHGESSFEATLQNGSGANSGGGLSDSDLFLGLGVTSLVVAAGLAAAWIGSWIALQDLEQSDEWQALRARPEFLDSPDFCSQRVTSTGAYLNEEQGRNCRRADTFEIMEWTFGFAALGVAAVGATFIVLGVTGSDSDPAESAFMVIPSLGPTHAALSIRGRL